MKIAERFFLRLFGYLYHRIIPIFLNTVPFVQLHILPRVLSSVRHCYFVKIIKCSVVIFSVGEFHIDCGIAVLDKVKVKQ